MELKPQSLFLRLLYLALGGLLMFLLIENRLIRAERDELLILSARSLAIIEKTNDTSSECLLTLANIRKQLYPAVWDADTTSPPSKTAIGGPKDQRIQAFK